MKIGNEMNHLGATAMEAEFNRPSTRAKIINALQVAAQFVLVCAAFFVIFLFMVALS